MVVGPESEAQQARAIKSATPDVASSFSTPTAPASAEKEKPQSFSEKQGQEAAIVFVIFIGLFIAGYFIMRRTPASVTKQKLDKKRKKRLKP